MADKKVGKDIHKAAARANARSAQEDHDDNGHAIHLGHAHSLRDQAANQSSRLILTTYNAQEFLEKDINAASDLADLHIQENKVTWLHIIGKPEQKTVEKVFQAFDIEHFSPLEVSKAHLKSRFEVFGDQCVMVAWSVSVDGGFRMHQLVMLVSRHYLVTWQTEEQDLTLSVREKLQKESNRIRRSGSDYLAYVLLSGIVDSYFPCLEAYGERLETVEGQILDNPSKRSISQIHVIKRDLLAIRRHIWSLREAVNSLLRDAAELFEHDTLINVRDSYDHVVQLIDVVETYRELGADLMDVYLSSISNRMNEVMKVLTIITTIFVPPGLIAAIYGMNFRQDKSPFNMPELSWFFGYPFALGLMAVLAIFTLSFFWWKGWLGETPKFMRSWKRTIAHSNSVNHHSKNQ